MKDVRLMMGDCLERMSEIADQSVDLVLCDLPYGTTDCKWDSVLPLDRLWAHYWRISKGPAILTATQPFTTMLMQSQLKSYKTYWIWNKGQSGSFALAKYHPLRVTEDVLVFCQKTIKVYNPIMRTGRLRLKGNRKSKNEIQSGLREMYNTVNDQYYPTNIIDITNSRLNKQHPTQKPVALMEYMIRTYTNPGAVVLDNCMGSGTTGVAAMNTGRRFIGIERDAGYFAVAERRIKETEAYQLLYGD